MIARQTRLAGAAAILMALSLLGMGCRPQPIPASPARTAIRLANVAAAAGLHYRWNIHGTRPLDLLQTIGNGCALLDYNNDGNLDVLLVGPKLALYAGDGKGHFTDVTHETGLDKLTGHFLGCAVGDYDNDGYDDVYITAYRGGLLLHNEGGKRFRNVSAQSGIAPQQWGTSASFVDVDGDGKLDLYVGDYVDFGAHAQRLCDYHGVLAACGPISYKPLRGHLYRNLGGGRFRDETALRGLTAAAGKTLGVACADYDRSGRQSIALANDEMPGNLFRDDGHTFTDIGTASGTAFDRNGTKHGGMGLDWGDYDNDGRLDLLVATYQQEVKNLYHNDGDGLFSDRAVPLGLALVTSPYVAFGAKFLDVDNDGWLDILLTNGHIQDNTAQVSPNTMFRQPTLLFHNRQGMAFDDASASFAGGAGAPIVGRGLAIGDFDNDGRVDALVVDGEGAPLLLHNETAGAGHWIEVRLSGQRSNRDGIGALVTFSAGGRTFLRLCHTDGSYMSASEPRVHCGLGSAASVRVSVRWPDGHTQVFPETRADQVVTLTEDR